jgi:hypothetical protein
VALQREPIFACEIKDNMTWLQALETVAASSVENFRRGYGALLMSVLCISLAESASTVADMLHLKDGDSLDMERASVLDLAQLVWNRSGPEAHAASAAKVGISLTFSCWRSLQVAVVPTTSSHCGTVPFGLQVLQSIAWERVAEKLPKGLQMRLALVLLTVYKAMSASPAGASLCEWVWRLFNGTVGATLTALHGVSTFSILTGIPV